jgi:hypothetical protein
VAMVVVGEKGLLSDKCRCLRFTDDFSYDNINGSRCCHGNLERKIESLQIKVLLGAMRPEA